MQHSWVYFCFCLTRSMVLSVLPCTSLSWTSQSKYLSPTRRNIASHQSARLSMSSGRASHRRSPSTVRVSILLSLYLLSSSMVCSAKGPTWMVQDFFHLVASCLTLRTSPDKKWVRTEWPTSVTARWRSLETLNSIRGFTSFAPSLASLLGGGVGLAKKCVMSSPSSTRTTACRGSWRGTWSTRLRCGTEMPFFMPADSRMLSLFTAG
mmetsp:Transcript_8560/g.19479  ORF Transcript_8560/g.19479 Transcript_8560/m.19479 type:complete len:208 (+) Transcript_8560:432-1055(+)